MKLTFYVHPSWRRSGAAHTFLLNPWWGNPLTNSSLFTKELFDAYLPDTSAYAITDDLAAADLVLAPYPHAWSLQRDPGLFAECARVAEAARLPLLVDGASDIEYPVKAHRAFVLRYGGYRFQSEAGRIQIPLLANDLLECCRGGVFEARIKKGEIPVVGFAGWASLTRLQRAKTIIKELPLRLHGLFDERYRACTKGVLWRERALALLARSPLVTLRQQRRATFSGSVKTATGDMRALHGQMADTILQSDYALDVRGDANNSARLFEILSLGRIPVILDTERNFPFADSVDYSSFALIVDFRDIKKLPERIAEFHNTISPERFERMQRNARDAYVNYFRIDALTRHLVEEVSARVYNMHIRSS